MRTWWKIFLLKLTWFRYNHHKSIEIALTWNLLVGKIVGNFRSFSVIKNNFSRWNTLSIVIQSIFFLSQFKASRYYCNVYRWHSDISRQIKAYINKWKTYYLNKIPEWKSNSLHDRRHIKRNQWSKTSRKNFIDRDPEGKV